MRRSIVLFVGAVFAVIATPAVATDQNDYKHCQGTDTNGSNDMVIRGCTALIESGDWVGKDLASIYVDRANAYFNKGDYDRAIHDFSKALKIRPDDKTAMADRGLAKIKMGDNEGGEADIAAAKAMTSN